MKALSSIALLLFLLLLLCRGGEAFAPLYARSMSSRSSGSDSRLPTAPWQSLSPLASSSSSPSLGHRLQQARHRSRLHIDFFGLGPAEIAVIVLAVSVFYGPDRLSKLRTKKGSSKDGEKANEKINEIWIRENKQRIDDLQEYADKARQQRAWQRINTAIEDGDPDMMARLEDLGDADVASLGK